MQALTLEDLDQEAAAFDAEVRATRDIDVFCSSSDWILPANASLTPPRQSWVFRGDHGYLTLMRSEHEDGWFYVAPLEAAWCLASPLIGRDTDRLAREACRLALEREHEWQIMMLAGLTTNSLAFRVVADLFSQRYALRLGPMTRRHVASLMGGLDGFLSRRSKNFRRNADRARRRVREAGIIFEARHAPDAAETEAHYERIIRIEDASWKGQQGVGIESGPMREFYGLMCHRLVARGALRTIFARHEGRDVGYILGGVLGDTYRGLQFSFDEDYRDYSLGTAMQIEQIEELCAEDYAAYDLGTDVAYKRRWAESSFDTVMLVVSK